MDQVLNILMDEKCSNEQNIQRFQAANPIPTLATPTSKNNPDASSNNGNNTSHSTNYGESTPKSEPMDVDHNKNLMYAGSKNYSSPSNERSK